MIEIQELAGGRLASRLLNVEAIQEVAGERERTHILMRDRTQHVVEISDRAFRSRLALVQADWQEEQMLGSAQAFAAGGVRGYRYRRPPHRPPSACVRRFRPRTGGASMIPKDRVVLAELTGRASTADWRGNWLLA